ncbi:Glucose import ATP-binding protein TsgD13 [Nymphon striatum]|nr:Glucose import ATP-binding protein TsgD13 [Nymphon striatum]
MGERQRVEILKALWRDARVLILDEPTAVLTPSEADELGRVTASMAEDGRSIIFISHKLDEVTAFCDEATVLRGGATVAASLDVDDLDADRLAELMVGEATAGEIVGIAGVAGNGQRPLADAIAGLIPSTGSITILDQDLSSAKPSARNKAGLAYVPEDRIGVGLAPRLDVTENAIMRAYTSLSSGPIIDRSAAASHAEGLIEKFNVKIAKMTEPLAGLSGGNLQRLLVGREVDGRPTVLIAAQPTRGLDVQGVAAIQEVLLAQAAAGVAILLISEDLDELLALSDRLLVMHEGAVVAEFEPDNTTRAQVGVAMTGAHA